MDIHKIAQSFMVMILIPGIAVLEAHLTLWLLQDINLLNSKKCRKVKRCT